MAAEHNFARGDILRKVLERTGIEAKRPLNLRRGAFDQTHGAELLRKLRGYSQNARLLSAKLDELIELALPPGSKYPLPVLESSWRRWKKPSRKTLGGVLRRHDPRSPIPTMVFRDQPHMFAAKGPNVSHLWKNMTKDTEKGLNIIKRKKAVLARKAAKKRKPWEQLSAKLDQVISFADPRPRNPQGEFSPQGEGGPDPNAMATVYKMPQQQGMGIGRTAGAALAGGALGATGGNIAKAGWTGVAEAIKKLAAKRKGVSRIVHP